MSRSGEFILLRPDPPQTSKVLCVASGPADLCQQQVYRSADRRLLCLNQTRPRAFGVLGSNSTRRLGDNDLVISPSRRVLPCIPTARVDELAQNLDQCHVRCNNNDSPSRHAHTALRHSPRATQGLLQYTDTDPVRPLGLHHLQRSLTGSREEVLHGASSNARVAFRDKNRRRVDSDLLRRFTGAGGRDTGSLSSQRSLQRARTVQTEIVPPLSSR